MILCTVTASLNITTCIFFQHLKPMVLIMMMMMTLGILKIDPTTSHFKFYAIATLIRALE